MSRQRAFPGPGHRYDLIVVGAGISGSEVAFAAATKGCDTLLVTTSLDTVYLLYGEEAVLEPPDGSLMAELRRIAADHRGRLRSWDLHRVAKQVLEELPGLHLLQSNVTGLLLDAGRAVGVETWEGVPRRADRVVLCVGTFLEARLTIGEVTEQAGRLGEMSYDELYLELAKHGFVFDSFARQVDGGAGTLPYEVRCKVFSSQETGDRPGSLTRIPGLFGAGVCVNGYQSYEQAAASGRELGLALAAACRP